MDEKEFFNNLGFDSNPFQFTNADDEDRLDKYFIPPPYFDSVWGNPEKPKSVVVFAPRGGGKTAQRKMIEFESQRNGEVLCVNYSRFEFSKKLQSITLYDHLQKIIQIIIIGILTKLNENPKLGEYLNVDDKKYLNYLIYTHLEEISEHDFKVAIDSLSNFSSRAKRFWNEHLGAINVGINLILRQLGSKSAAIDRINDHSKFNDSYKYQLEKIYNMSLKLGFNSIYILIDKIDETDITGNDANLSSKLVEPILKDLDLLEMKGYSYKFFLWNKLERYYKEYGRKDRISYYDLVWKNSELNNMLSKRLEAYSHNKINDFSQILDYDFGIDINTIIILFAQKSPRDAIRIIQDIISEQREINPYSRKISYQAVMKGVEVFSHKKSSEITDIDDIRELRKIGQIEFTINFLANKIYKCPQNTVRTKIKKWSDRGIIEKIGTEKGKKRLVNKYSISDVRIAKTIFPDLSVEQFLELKYSKCRKCNTNLLRDWDNNENKICHNCSTEIKNVTENKFTKKKMDGNQKTLFDF